MMRQGRMREEVAAAGIDPDKTTGDYLREFAVTAPVELALAALPAARLFPKTMGTAAGLGAFFGGTSEAGSADEEQMTPDKVKELQIKLRDAGLYTGEIDGQMGPNTRAARQQFEAQEAQRAQQEIQRQQAEADKMRAQAEAEGIEFEREKARREAEQREAGETRMREMSEGVSPIRQALRDYGPLAGYVPGLIGG